MRHTWTLDCYDSIRSQLVSTGEPFVIQLLPLFVPSLMHDPILQASASSQNVYLTPVGPKIPTSYPLGLTSAGNWFAVESAVFFRTAVLIGPVTGFRLSSSEGPCSIYELNRFRCGSYPTMLPELQTIFQAVIIHPDVVTKKTTAYTDCRFCSGSG